MEILDIRGKTVNVGASIRYTGTGTTGEVSAVKLENNEGWVKLDESDVWYNSEYMELLDKTHKKIGSSKEDKTAKALEKAKKMKKDLEEINMGSELCDGGG
ncbi:DUF2098 domain-containing protein [Methanobacterium alcaliphilum]|uniref:DUF2098 domain-containing protein n=1 Tax=Methanobacterium alcaliphilum TaxID=392018 RepID=UPI00200A687F|nr:DUF2098 family protein [Methanobacterium alcaliphilum]MCK9150882.1 DUF2098 family protein [Methanobacterium alcaliphilum]